MSINLFGQTTIIINSSSLAIELLEKKGAIYSDRPRMPVAGELMGWEYGIGLHRYNSRLKHLRKLLAQAIGTRSSLVALSQHQEYEVRGFLYRVMTSPETLAKHVHRWALLPVGTVLVSTKLTLHRYTGASILRFTYDYNVDSDDDHLVRIVDHAMNALNRALTPGAFLADIFPIRKCHEPQTAMSSLFPSF